MKEPKMNTIHTPSDSVEQAEYLLVQAGNATVLCEKHKEAFVDLMTLMEYSYDQYLLPADDPDPVNCQACHLAQVRANLIRH